MIFLLFNSHKHLPVFSLISQGLYSHASVNQLLQCIRIQSSMVPGKTLLARAVAHHTDCTFIRVSGSELVQKFIGEGSRMVRELFVMAREHAPSIIFMDEIDSIGSSRIESGSGGDSEVQRTMLELLNQLDGFEATKNIKVSIVMADVGCVSDLSIYLYFLMYSLFLDLYHLWHPHYHHYQNQH